MEFSKIKTVLKVVLYLLVLAFLLFARYINQIYPDPAEVESKTVVQQETPALFF